MSVELLPLNENVSYLADAVAVYTEYSGGDPRYNQHFFRMHMQRAAYIGLVAQVDEQIVGIAFGSQAMRGQWWRERVAYEIGDDHAAFKDAWVLVQLNVLQDYRSQGIGDILHNTIIKQQPFKQVLLSTPKSNKGAQQFYTRHGWKVLHTGFPFARGAEPFMIFQLQLDK
jgi:ribosomal protein S18 acetylase RimI-like enzyme